MPDGFAEQPESYAVEFLASREGLELNKAFARITDPRVRRSIVELVRSFAGEVRGRVTAGAPIFLGRLSFQCRIAGLKSAAALGCAADWP